MKMPSMRFTLRRTMVAVAILGFLINWGITSQKRRDRFLVQWQDHGMKARKAKVELAIKANKFLAEAQKQAALKLATPSLYNDYEKIRGELQAHFDYESRLVAKYDWASRFPWLPIEPDPPEPK